MLITRNNILTGMPVEREIDVNQEQIQAWKNGKLIQDAMPSISPSDREFFISGVTDEDWEKMSGDQE